jgi:hypothetical protein
MLAHIEIEPEQEEDPEEEEVNDQDKISDEEEAPPKYKLTIPNIQQYWLSIDPSLDDYCNVILNCFTEGLECLKNFERWSKHDDLTPYANALEEWDDMVGDNWDPPDNNYLDPHSWINENPVYLEQRENIIQVFDSSFNKC